MLPKVSRSVLLACESNEEADEARFRRGVLCSFVERLEPVEPNVRHVNKMITTVLNKYDFVCIFKSFFLTN